jgi:hypothetical protein
MNYVCVSWLFMTFGDSSCLFVLFYYIFILLKIAEMLTVLCTGQMATSLFLMNTAMPDGPTITISFPLGKKGRNLFQMNCLRSPALELRYEEHKISQRLKFVLSPFIICFRTVRMLDIQVPGSRWQCAVCFPVVFVFFIGADKRQTPRVTYGGSILPKNVHFQHLH